MYEIGNNAVTDANTITDAKITVDMVKLIVHVSTSNVEFICITTKQRAKEFMTSVNMRDINWPTVECKLNGILTTATFNCSNIVSVLIRDM